MQYSRVLLNRASNLDGGHRAERARNPSGPDTLSPSLSARTLGNLDPTPDTLSPKPETLNQGQPQPHAPLVTLVRTEAIQFECMQYSSVKLNRASTLDGEGSYLRLIDSCITQL